MKPKDRDELLIRIDERIKGMDDKIDSHGKKLDMVIPKVEDHDLTLKRARWFLGAGFVAVLGLIGDAIKDLFRRG